jgi:hypothetical protein
MSVSVFSTSHRESLLVGSAIHRRMKAGAFELILKPAFTPYVLGVEQSNDPGGVSTYPGHPLDTDDSDTFAGDFVKYALLLTRPSRAVGVAPLKFEAHLVLPRGYCSPQPLPLIHFL